MICHAIVLKNSFPERNKVTILHEQFGKINFFVREHRQASLLCNGSLIFCEVVKKESSYQCQFIDAYFIPLDQSRFDIYFVHDILKICLHFAPWQVQISDVFDIICMMYQKLDMLDARQKKIYLLKIFLYLGIFPENVLLYQVVMQNYQMIDHDIDQLLRDGLEHCWKSQKNLS